MVEDDAELRAYITDVLRNLNYRVLSASSAQAALTMLLQDEPVVDLLLTDVVMPGINGRELGRRAQQFRPSLKVLYMTGYSRNAVVHQGRLDEGVHLLEKPVSQGKLALRVREILTVPDHLRILRSGLTAMQTKSAGINIVLYMPRQEQGVGQSVPAVAVVLVAISENFHCVRNPCSRSKVPQSGSLIHDRPVSCGVRVWHFSSRDQIELESGRAATTLIFGLTRTSAEAWPRASSPALPLASCPRSASAFPSARLPPCAASWRAWRPSSAPAQKRLGRFWHVAW